MKSNENKANDSPVIKLFNLIEIKSGIIGRRINSWNWLKRLNILVGEFIDKTEAPADKATPTPIIA